MTDVVRSVSVRLSANTSQYLGQMRAAGAETEAISNRTTQRVSANAARQEKALRAVGLTAKYSLGVAAIGFGAAVKESADFAEKMTLVRTLAHATADEMDRLSAAALNVGTKYGYTATEVADAQAELIKAGISVNQVLGGALTGTLTLAAAGQTDVATATEIAASAMTQFKLKASDIPHLADLLAAGADKALGSVSDLGEGLKQAGTTAHQYGLDVDQTVGTLAAFAQAGLIGERGGTVFKQMLLQLAGAQGETLKLMDRLGISLYDVNGNIKTIPALADNLRSSLKDLTPEARNSALAIIFGSRAIQGANILLADGGKQIQGWIDKVNDQGFAAQQASGKLDSLKGDVQKFGAATQAAFIELGTGSQSPIRELVQNTTAEIQKLTRNGDLKKWGDEVVTDFERVADAGRPIARVLGGTLHTLGSDAKQVADAFNSLPADVQKLLLTGGLLAYGANKVGILKPALKGLTSGGGLGGVASRATPVPVFVTNEGFGGVGGGGAGTGSKVGKAGKAGVSAGLSGTVFTAGSTIFGLGVAQQNFDTLDTFGRGKAAGKQFDTIINAAAIKERLAKSNVGKYAGALGINIEALALDLAKNGSNGDYVKELQKRLGKRSVGGLLSAEFGQIAPFVTTKEQKKLDASGDFNKIVERVADGIKAQKEQVADLEKLLGIKPRNPRKPKAPRGKVGPTGVTNVPNTGNSDPASFLFPGGHPSTSNPADAYAGTQDILGGVLGLFGHDSSGPSTHGRRAAAELIVSVDMDPSKFNRKAARLKAIAKQLDLDPSVDLNINPALRKLRRLQAKFNSVAGALGPIVTGSWVGNGGADGDPSTPYLNGGYTGNYPIHQQVGVVHGREWVMDARATAGNEAGLAALQRSLRAGGKLNASGQVAGIARRGAGGGGFSDQDINRLATAMSRIQPMYGPVHISGDPTQFRRQMENDRALASLGGQRPE